MAKPLAKESLAMQSPPPDDDGQVASHSDLVGDASQTWDRSYDCIPMSGLDTHPLGLLEEGHSAGLDAYPSLGQSSYVYEGLVDLDSEVSHGLPRMRSPPQSCHDGEERQLKRVRLSEELYETGINVTADSPSGTTEQQQQQQQYNNQDATHTDSKDNNNSTILSGDSKSAGFTPLPTSQKRRGRKQSLTEDSCKRFVCELCDSRFRRQEHLKRHYRCLHTQDKPFECKKCDKKFSRSDNLAHHYAVIHCSGAVHLARPYQRPGRQSRSRRQRTPWESGTARASKSKEPVTDHSTRTQSRHPSEACTISTVHDGDTSTSGLASPRQQPPATFTVEPAVVQATHDWLAPGWSPPNHTPVSCFTFENTWAQLSVPDYLLSTAAGLTDFGLMEYPTPEGDGNLPSPPQHGVRPLG